MNPKTTHKIIAASGMAVVIAVGVAVFFLRSPPVTPVAQIAEPTAPLADTAAPVTDAAAPVAAAPAADVPAAAAVVAQSDTASSKSTDRAAPAVAAKPARHREAANLASDADASSRITSRSATVSTTTDTPSVADRVDRSADLNAAPLTASSSTGSPDAAMPAEANTSDSQITSDVKSAIAVEGLAKDANIDVTTTHGVVALSGTVPSQSAIEQVKDVAGKVKDVKAVDTSGLMLASL